MAESSGAIDIQKLIAWSDDLVLLLKDTRDADDLSECFVDRDNILSSCDAQLEKSLSQIEECETRIEECKRETEKVKLQIVGDEELGLLSQELQSELERESISKEELRGLLSEITALEQERNFFEVQERSLQKLEQEKLRAWRKLSMYASVTNVIPYLEDVANISGHILHRDKKSVEKFEFDPANSTSFEICQTIWKAIDS